MILFASFCIVNFISWSDEAVLMASEARVFQNSDRKRADVAESAESWHDDPCKIPERKLTTTNLKTLQNGQHWAGHFVPIDDLNIGSNAACSR